MAAQGGWVARAAPSDEQASVAHTPLPKGDSLLVLRVFPLELREHLRTRQREARLAHVAAELNQVVLDLHARAGASDGSRMRHTYNCECTCRDATATQCVHCEGQSTSGTRRIMTNLIAPFQHVVRAVLDAPEYVKELLHPVLSHYARAVRLGAAGSELWQCAAHIAASRGIHHAVHGRSVPSSALLGAPHKSVRSTA